MTTDKTSERTIVALIIIVLLSLLVYIGVNKRSTATAAPQSSPIVVEQRNVNYEDLIHAYNMVLHRVLIDRPSYFEDVLVESPEFCRLDILLFPEDLDEIYNMSISDSLEYENNRTSEIADPRPFKSSFE